MGPLGAHIEASDKVSGEKSSVAENSASPRQVPNQESILQAYQIEVKQAN